MSDEPVNIDRDKLRAAIRRLGPEYVFYMLDDAIDLLPLAELEGIAKKLFAVADKVATAEQREALAKVADRQARGHSEARKP
jgi:formate-dependent phosphoribosylglycinamide formyltransferase (GAR transformylase)